MLSWYILCLLSSSVIFTRPLQLINAAFDIFKLKIFKLPGIAAKMHVPLPDMVQYWNSENVPCGALNDLKISAWLKWLMVLVLESVSCLTPTEFKTLQPATSQLEEALNNSRINHGKSTASLEDFCFVLFGYFFFLWCRIKKQLQVQDIPDCVAGLHPAGFLIEKVDSPCSNWLSAGLKHAVQLWQGFFCKIFLTK